MRQIHKGQIRSFNQMCCGPGYEQAPHYEAFENMFDWFFGAENGGDGSTNTLQNALHCDVGQYGVDTYLRLWALLWPHIIEKQVLHRFAADCLQRAEEIWQQHMPESDLAGRVIAAAYINAENPTPEECNTLCMEVVAEMDNVPSQGPAVLLLRVMHEMMKNEPGGGAIACARLLPLVWELEGTTRQEETEAQLSIIDARCAEQGYFDPE